MRRWELPGTGGFMRSVILPSPSTPLSFPRLHGSFQNRWTCAWQTPKDSRTFSPLLSPTCSASHKAWPLGRVKQLLLDEIPTCLDLLAGPRNRLGTNCLLCTCCKTYNLYGNFSLSSFPMYVFTYSCFTMLCYFLLYTEMNQLYMCVIKQLYSSEFKDKKFCQAISCPSWTFTAPSHPSRSSQRTELSSLCYITASHQLAILHMAITPMSIPISQFIPPFYMSTCPFSMSLSLFLPCK